MEISNKIYEELLSKNVDVAIDDREETVGVRMNDLDLMGIPFKIIVGKKAINETKIEVKRRDNGQTYEIPVSQALDEIISIIKEEYKKYKV